MHPLEWAALWAVGAVLVVGGLLWATGEISGRLFGGVWPNTRFAEMGLVLARFHAHAEDPALAWPAPERALIPGPMPFYSTLAVLLVPSVAGMLLVIRHRARTTRSRGAGARWAKTRDLRTLRVRASQPRRLTLGRIDGHLIAAEPRESVIVIGPTQSGKTTGFAIPAILEWQGPVLATSIKSDLLNDTYAARSAIPDADFLIYDPTHSTGYATAGWTPLAGCETWQGAQRVASWLVDAARATSAGIENARFWYGAAEKLLAPLLLAAVHGDVTMEAVVRWLDTQDEREVKFALELANQTAAKDAFEATLKREERTRSNVYATAETVLAAYADPGVLASAETSDIHADAVLDGGHHTVYVCAPAHEQRRLRPLFSAFIQAIVAGAYERANRSGKPLDPPLLLVLDECANIAPLRDLPTLASTGAGQGIQLVSVFQDMAQINAVYGRDHAPTIVSNHRAKVVLSGIGDPRTLDYVAALLGDEEVRQVASTRGAEGRRSTTESFTYRTLAPSHVLREMTPGQGVLVYGHLPPARLSMRPWFKDPQLQRAARGASRGAVRAEGYRERHGRQPHSAEAEAAESPTGGTRA
jgi:type IV secretion system protein VirD4